MATGTFRSGVATTTTAPIDIARIAWLVVRAMGSLKITVAMFALGTLILFVGTLAQDEETIVDVKKQYFNSWVASVPFDVFRPQTIWPHTVPLPYAFAIPGGASVGLILLINLIAAKMTRFSMNAKGGRFVAGVFFTAIGFVLVGLIVVSAHLGDGLQGEPPFSYDWLWSGVKASVWGLTAGALVWCIGWNPKTKVVRWTIWTLTAILLGVSYFLIATNDAFRIPDPGLRIVWQLTKSLIVSVVLLTGLLLLFGNRGGNVLIHLGVGLLMLGQFIFGDGQHEERMAIFEGQRTQVAYELDTVELVFIDKSDSDMNHVVAFEHPMLQKSFANKKFLSSEKIPFEVRVDRWMTNSTREDRKRAPQPSDDDYQLTGAGIREYEFKELPKSGGAKSQSNYATAYVTLRNKEEKKEIGSFAVSQLFNDDAIMYKSVYEQAEASGKSWDFGLRFRRNYKPYSVVLDDVVMEEYTGTSKPKDYSSFVKINDAQGDTLQQGRIWMNNPMRFRGETFYQSGYMNGSMNPYGVEQTTLQVVTNAGWLIPYVACVLCGLGMLVHFGGTFARFASRYDRLRLATGKASAAMLNAGERSSSQFGSILGVAIPVILCGSVALWIVRSAMTPKAAPNTINWYAIGEIPVQYGGRIKPLASAAGEVLETISNKRFALSKEGHVYEPEHKNGKSIEASKWIMSVFAREEWVLDSPLIRIDAAETTGALGLKRHKSNRYSYNQIREGLSKIPGQVDSLFKTKRDDWSFEQAKLAEAIDKLSTLDNLFDAYTPLAPRVSQDPSQMVSAIRSLQPEVDRIRARSPIAIIPPLTSPISKSGEKAPPAKWDAFGPALFETVKNKTTGVESKTESVLNFMALVESFSSENKDASKINEQVREFKEGEIREFGSTIRVGKVPFEAWYEHFSPVYIANCLYVVCGMLALLSFIFARTTLRRSAFWLCVITLVVHTTAIVCRVYISERPPVATLYSAAVFIGWATVLFCTVTELLFPVSIAVLVGSVTGFLTLLVAHGIVTGDTMPVLEAVLDTQFWLATHVVSVSLGYSATFVAGFLGIGIVIVTLLELLPLKRKSANSAFLKSVAPKSGEGWQFGPGVEVIPTLYRICYGVVCFGLFFSFVGTVLGGLWGDDSWGRFWGWDPKENGAMMIVLWNALLLHAKWDKMIKALGFGILAVFGNVITAWSMFGTNLLGVGLHSYGFNATTLNYLAFFALSQILVIALGVVLAMIRGGRSKAELE